MWLIDWLLDNDDDDDDDDDDDYYYYYYYYVNKNHVKRVIDNEYKSENKNWYENITCRESTNTVNSSQ